MKKTFAILAAFCIFSMGAFAQDKQIFNHLSVGPAIGDGLGVEIAMPIGPQFQVRAGYSFVIPLTLNLDLSAYASTLFGSNSIPRDLSNIPVTPSIWKGGLGNIMFDFFPSKTGSFHLSAGILIGSGSLANVKVNLTSVLKPNEYGTLAIGPEGKEPLSSDKNGFAYIDWKVNPVMPFIGLGWGRPCRQDRLVSVVFDMGVAFSGKGKIQSYNYVPSTPKTVELNSTYFNNQDKGLIDAIAGIPVYPMLKLTVFFRCF